MILALVERSTAVYRLSRSRSVAHSDVGQRNGARVEATACELRIVQFGEPPCPFSFAR